MDEDELCERIKENLLVLGVSKNKSLSDVASFTLEDIRSLYETAVRQGHIFYFQNKDRHIDAKKAYNFFINLFQEHEATTLGDIIPRQYLTDLIGELDMTLIRTHEEEQKLIEKSVNEMRNRHLKDIKEAEQKKIENYNKYYAKNYEIKKKMKELKKKKNAKKR